jgi:lipoprotein-anchoring transpeptidase ErfK/SrfK
MGFQSRRLAILSFGVTILAIGLECASAEECDYTTCGSLMARDAVSGPNDYSPDTKRACAELNACARRAKNSSAGRAVVPPGAGSGTLKSIPKGPATALKPEIEGKQSEGTQPAPTYPYPPRYRDVYRDTEPYEDPNDQLYAPRPPRVVHPPPASYPYPAGSSSYSSSVPGVVPSPQGTEIAALPPEYQPEPASKEAPPQFHRAVVDYPTMEPPGTIIVDTPNTYLYLTMGRGKAIRYGIGVGREGFTWSGTERISQMKEWPDWLPPPEMIKRQPYLPRFMAGGETNPLGARAMYLGNTEYRIHGTNQPSTIGTFVSSGCIRLTNADVEDLYSRVRIGTRVIVLPGANTAASPLRPRS